MPLSLYTSFLIYALAATILPGPNNVLLMSEAAGRGLRKCLPLLFGIWTGLLCVMSLAAGFMTVLNRILPQITPVFRILGAAYILYLALKTLKRKGIAVQDTKEEGELPGFPRGFLLQFLNVKVLMLGLAVYPGYFLNDSVTLPQQLLIPLFALSMTACCGVGNLIWMVGGSLIRPFYDRFYRVINMVMALLLVYCAFRILIPA